MQGKNKKQANINYIINLIIGKQDSNKTIDKALLQMILPQNQTPHALLSSNNLLIKFLSQKCPNDLSAAQDLYSSHQSFYLLQIGLYCAIGNDEESFLLFNSQIVTYLALHKVGQEDDWGGFTYEVNKKVYIGNFLGEKAEGKGLGIFYQGDVYHEFKGLWRQGKIENGERTTCKKDTQQVILHYDGGFKDFQFHGKGTKTKNGKKIQATFENGSRSLKSKRPVKGNPQIVASGYMNSEPIGNKDSNMQKKSPGMKMREYKESTIVIQQQ